MFTILKKSTTPKISPKAKGDLTYHIGTDNQGLHIRITQNGSGGFFSNEWVSLDAIDQILPAGNETFRALILKPLYHSKGANNHGFLAAALRAEGILEPADSSPLLHVKGDSKPFNAAMQKLIKSGVTLEDDVAIAEKAKAEKRAAMVEAMKKPSPPSPKKSPARSKTPPAKTQSKA